VAAGLEAAGLREPVVLAWSGGKDSALALDALRSSPDFEVVELLTTVTEEDGRIGMHRVRGDLLGRQAESAGLPLTTVKVPAGPSNEIYEERMGTFLAAARSREIRRVAFGDLFLRDIREYRERQLAAAGMEALFPLWGRDTAELAKGFIRKGFKAVLICVDTAVLPPSFAGRPFDEALLRDLPPGVDPCGENGEFHTFVHDGPIFREPIPFRLAGSTIWERFCFQDLQASAPE
jgi:uncharacterized protein (TIGR00290 family)